MVTLSRLMIGSERVEPIITSPSQGVYQSITTYEIPTGVESLHIVAQKDNLDSLINGGNIRLCTKTTLIGQASSSVVITKQFDEDEQPIEPDAMELTVDGLNTEGLMSVTITFSLDYMSDSVLYKIVLVPAQQTEP